MLSAGLAVAPDLLAQDEMTPPPAEAGQLVAAYPFGSLRLEYDSVHPEVPLIESLASLPVQIDTTGETIDYSQSATGVTLGQLLTLSNRQISVSAINEISRVIVAELNRQGIVGVLVAPEPTQIDPGTATDLR